MLYSGFGATAILNFFLTKSVIDPAQAEAIEINRLGKINKTIELGGRIIPNATYFLGMLSYGYFNNHDKVIHMEAINNAEIMGKATAYAALVTTILKYSFRERRPSGGGRTSFPSGHTTTAFAFASVIGTRHAWYFGVPAYIVASLVGYNRLNDNAHYLHDIVAGATIGTVFGLGMSALYDKKIEQKTTYYYFGPIKGGLSFNLTHSF